MPVHYLKARIPGIAHVVDYVQHKVRKVRLLIQIYGIDIFHIHPSFACPAADFTCFPASVSSEIGDSVIKPGNYPITLPKNIRYNYNAKSNRRKDYAPKRSNQKKK